MSKTTNKFAPDVREQGVRMVSIASGITLLDGRPLSIAEKVNCVPKTLYEWVKKAEVDSGKRIGVPAGVAYKMKALNAMPASNVRPTGTVRATGQPFSYLANSRT